MRIEALEKDILNLESKIQEQRAAVERQKLHLESFRGSDFVLPKLKAETIRQHEKSIEDNEFLIASYRNLIKFNRFLIEQERKGMELHWVAKEEVHS
jgi:hypothetical protein